MPYAAVNGLNMYYEVHGDGPPLLLLHGGSGSIPERWIAFFADRFQVIAIERRRDVQNDPSRAAGRGSALGSGRNAEGDDRDVPSGRCYRREVIWDNEDCEPRKKAHDACSRPAV